MNSQISTAQDYSDLKLLEGYNFDLYYSFGNESRAEGLASQMNNVVLYFKDKLQMEPEVTILILSPDDWGKYTSFPVYGMPHYFDKKLVIASENNEFWNSFIPPSPLPTELAEDISKTYVDENGNLSMQKFFDLLAIHEIGHAYHFQAGLNMQRMWMGELFCNILLHTYIAENEPDLLPALTVFPQMVISSGKGNLKFTSLQDIEERYNEIGQKYPQNYGWYQCRWHSAAEQIYLSGGIETLIKLWTTLQNHKMKLSDEELVLILSKEVHQSVADVMLKWDEL